MHTTAWRLSASRSSARRSLIVFSRVARDAPDVRPTEPGLLYVGSSPYASDDESAICDEWIAAIRHSPDPRLANARIVIRPHPADHSWDGWRPPDNRVALSTSHKGEPERLLALIARRLRRRRAEHQRRDRGGDRRAAGRDLPSGVTCRRAGGRAALPIPARGERRLRRRRSGPRCSRQGPFSAPPSRLEPGRDQTLPRTVLAPGGAGTTCLPDRGREDHRAASDPSRIGPCTHRRWTARRLGPSGSGCAEHEAFELARSRGGELVETSFSS